ncbi:MAG: CYTH domain-containing protein [Bacteroidetes bacterium]|nr:MAG: CYTH domain-containing protein [Bacteroidota bacterium]
MATEIEVKILEIDRTALEQRLEALGATRSFDGEMLAQFYDWPGRGLTQAGQVLRLRREGDVVQFTFKEHISREGAKAMEEYETTVEDPAVVQKILRVLGLEAIKETRKFRTQYELGDAHVVIDDYQGELAAIPPFLEIEAPRLDRLYEVVALLGYQTTDCLNWSTYELVQHYGLK